MVEPTGYSALDIIGFTDRGDYAAGSTYVKNDLVHYNDNIWRCKYDDTTGQTPAEGTYWTLWIDGNNNLSDLSDTAITSPSNGDVLEYDSSTSKWKNSGALGQLKNAFTNQVNANGSKNILPVSLEEIKKNNTAGTWSNNVYTYGGVTYTINSDGSISLSGTSGSGASALVLTSDFDVESDIDFVLSQGSRSNVPALFLQENGTPIVVVDTSTASEIAFNLNAKKTVSARLYIAANTAYSGTVYPMITLKTDYDLDSTYAPPAKTNRQLTEDSVSWEDESLIGAVNYLKTNISTQVLGGVTLTANVDGSYNCSGNVAANSNNRVDSSPITLKKGTYIFYCSSDAHSPVGNDNCFAFIYGINGTSVWTRSYIANAGNDGSCGVFTLTQDSTITFGVCCFNNTGSAVAVNTTFYPGIYPVSYNGPYVPHAKTNKELTEDVTTNASAIASVKSGVLNINPIEVTENTPTTIISSAGVYLISITGGAPSYDAFCFASVHGSWAGGSLVQKLFESTPNMHTFDISTAGVVKLTSTQPVRVRLIKLSAGNY